MVEHADRVDQVHALKAKWRARQIALDHVDVVEIAGVLRRRVYGRSDVDADDVLGAEGCGQTQVAALAAARVQDPASLEGLASNGGDPAEPLLVVLRADLREVRPLVAEAPCRRGGLLGECLWEQAGDSTGDRVAGGAAIARKLPLHGVPRAPA